jgi:hypothetical protein
MKLSYAMLVCNFDAEDAIDNLKLVKPYVDGCIVVYDQFLRPEYIKAMSEYAIMSPLVWTEDENIVIARNQYLNLSRTLGFDWCIWSDPDEHFSQYTLEHIREAIDIAEQKGYNCLDMNVRDWYLDNVDGSELSEEPHEESSNFWKTLVIKLKSDIYMDGAGYTRNRHEVNRGTLKLGKLPKEFYYRHERSHKEVWEGAIRNFFITGGGDGFGRTNPLYVEFKDICNEIGIYLWLEKDGLREYMLKGNIDQRLKDFLIKHRNDYDEKWKEELRDGFRWYFYVIHPEENINNLRVDPPPPPNRDFAEQTVWDGYLKYLLREPDEGGFKHYVSLIRNGQLNKQQFEWVLQNSDEGKNRVVM